MYLGVTEAIISWAQCRPRTVRFAGIDMLLYPYSIARDLSVRVGFGVQLSVVSVTSNRSAGISGKT